MINREITYERNLTGSYIRIASAIDAEFDEKILLSRRIKGLLPMEKTYLNHSGQYWYNISGVQTLETYIKIHEPDYQMVEKLMLSICEQIHILEWNLLEPEILQFEPEYIFVSNRTQEFVFMVYPGSESGGISDLQKLAEYLLTKINHRNEDSVQQMYTLYDCMIKDGYTISDLKEDVESIRSKRICQKEESEYPEVKVIKPMPQREDARVVSERSGKARWQDFLVNNFSIVRWILDQKEKQEKRKAGKRVELIYPEEVDENEPEYIQNEQPEYYPTVCISVKESDVDGLLKYEGNLTLEDIWISEDEIRIGKGYGVSASINVDTISHLHARIMRDASEYYIEDMNSTNGTFLNDEMLPFHEKRKLEKNDSVRFANVTYRFV